jgi:hypothetical protein
MAVPGTKCKKSKAVLIFLFCAPAWNRTKNNGLEVRSYIHLTTGANILFFNYTYKTA